MFFEAVEMELRLIWPLPPSLFTRAHLVGCRLSGQWRLEELRLLLFDDGSQRLAQGSKALVVQTVESAAQGGGDYSQQSRNTMPNRQRAHSLCTACTHNSRIARTIQNKQMESLARAAIFGTW